MVLRYLNYLFIALLFVLPENLWAQPVEVVVQSGHSIKFDIDFSPDGKHLATGSWDNSVKIWDIKLMKEFVELNGHEEFIHTVRYSNDGNYILSASDDYFIKIWDAHSFQLVRSIHTNTQNYHAEFSPDGKTIASGGADSVIYIWNAENGSLLDTMSYHQGMINSLCFHPTGKYLFVGSSDSTVSIWNTKDYTYYGSIDSEDKVKHVAVDDTGKYLQYATIDGKTTVWRLLPEIENLFWVYCQVDSLITQNLNYYDCSNSSFSPDGKVLAYIDKDYRLVLDHLEKEKSSKYYTGHTMFVNAVRFSRDGKYIATASQDLSIQVFDLRHWDVDKHNDISYKTLKGYADMALSVAVSPDCKKMAISGYGLNIFDLETGKSEGLESFPGIEPNTVEFMPDGKHIIYQNGDNRQLNVMNIESKQIVKKLDYGSRLYAYDLSKNGKTIAIGGPANVVKIFDVESGELLYTHKVGSPVVYNQIHTISISPDGKSVAYACKDSLIEILDLTDRKLKGTLEGHRDRVMTLAFHPSGKYLASGAFDGHVAVWSLKKMELYRVVKQGMSVMSLDFSPDGKKLITGGLDITVKQWDWKKRQIIHETTPNKEHSGFVISTAYFADGKYYVSGAQDYKLNIYNAQSGVVEMVLYPLLGLDVIPVTADNYYIGSLNVSNAILFRKENKPYPFEQFDLKYNRPDLVLKTLGYASNEMVDAYERAYHKRLKKLGFEESQLSNEFHVPQITLSNKDSLPFSTYNKSQKISIKAEDEKYKLHRMNVYNNNVPVFGLQGIDIASLNAHQHEREIEIELMGGDNKIQVSVLNEKGVESLKETVGIYRFMPEKSPDLYVVTIGTSTYQDDRFNLHYAAKDARDLSAYLKSDTGLYHTVHTLTFTDAEVTLDCLPKIRTFLEKATIDDLVMVCLSGHGVLDENFDYYFASHDIDFDQPSLKGIPYRQLEQLLDGIKSLKKMLFMDTCHSGELDEDEVDFVSMEEVTYGEVKFRNAGVAVRGKDELGIGNTTALMKEMFTDLRKGTGATIIASSGGVEFAIEGEKWKNGLFTYCLLKGLKERSADMDKNGSIYLSELQRYVATEVSKLSQGKQVPTSRIENLVMDYRIW